MSEFENEFPDEHSHKPEFSMVDGAPRANVFACDDEGRHYHLSVTLSHEGIIADVYDRYGEECLATFARTYDELVYFVFANDPGVEENPTVESPSGYTFRESQENGDFVDCEECGKRVNDDYPFANDNEGYLYHAECLAPPCGDPKPDCEEHQGRCD